MNFFIGDVQGCFAQLTELIEKIEGIDPHAHLYFAGDLVNRGPDSLSCLRTIKNLGPRAHTVLGNHDLHLLAVAYGVRPAHKHDTLDSILNAPDREELLTWLRQQPLALQVDQHLLVHAGVLPNWTAQQVIALAAEVSQTLASAQFLDLLKNMYGNTPNQWSDDLKGDERSRCIINALTRIRYCTADGAMNLSLKEGLEQAPSDVQAWYQLPQRKTADQSIIFGHWSTLGLLRQTNITCLDTGCVWGGQLTALSSDGQHLIQVQSPQQFAPFS